MTYEQGFRVSLGALGDAGVCWTLQDTYSPWGKPDEITFEVEVKS